jgi:hypothetical protein
MALAESEARWNKRQSWVIEAEAAFARGRTTPELHQTCRTEFVYPEYDIFIDCARKWQLKPTSAANFLIGEQRAYVEKISAEDEIIETNEDYLKRVLFSINRHLLTRRRVESALTPEQFYKTLEVILLPENKHFLTNLAAAFDWEGVNLGMSSREGIVLIGLLPQPKDDEKPPLHLAGFPVSEEFAAIYKSTKPLKLVELKQHF